MTEKTDGVAETTALASFVSSEPLIDRPGELLKAAVEIAEKHVIAGAVKLTDPRDGTEGHFVVSHNDVTVLPANAFDQYRQFPLYREGTARLDRLDSFIALVQRFSAPYSAIFANEDPKTPSLTAVFDYHPANAGLGDGANYVQAMRHRAQYDFPLSDEWQAWFGNNSQVMSMIDFALFLEDHIVDISADDVNAFSEASRKFVQANRGELATPTKLFEIATGLKIYENSVVKEVRNLSSGEAQITFDAEHTDGDGKPLSLPTMFSIVIPVFARSNVAHRLIAKFRYRKTGDGIKFWYDLWRPDLTFQDAFDEAVSTVGAATGLPIYPGAPEKRSA